MAATPKTQRWKQLALRALATLSLLVAFALASLGSLLLHSNVPVVRAVATEIACSVLSELFEGRIVIAPLDRLSAHELHVAKVEVQDAAGTPLLKAHDITVRAALLDIVSELLLEDGELAAVVRHVRIERVEGALALNPATGRTTLEEALTLARKPSAQPTGPAKPERPVSVWLPVIEVGEIRAAIALGQPQQLEAVVHNSKGRVSASPRGVEVEVERFASSVLGFEPGELRGTGTTHLHFPGTKTVEFQGFLNQLEFHLRGQQTGRHVTLAFDVPHAEPAQVAPLVPNWPLRVPAAAYLRASGDWPDLEVSGQLRLDQGGTLDTEGTLRIDDAPKANLTFFVNKLDLQSFIDTGPHTELTLNGHTTLTLTKTGPRAEISASSNSTEIGDQSIPGLELAGTVDETGVSVEGRLRDASATGMLRLTAKRGQKPTIQLKLDDTNLSALDSMPDGVAGIASLNLDGTLEDQRLRWKLNGHAQRVRVDDVSADKIEFDASGETPLANPSETHGAVHLTASGVAAGNFSMPGLKLDAQGPWRAPRIALRVNSDPTHWAELKGQAQLTPELVLRDLELQITERDLLLNGKIKEFRPRDSAIEVQELSLSGAGGSLQGWLRYRPGLLESNVDARELDLARIAHALGLESHQLRGKLDLKLDLAAGNDVKRGRMALTLVNASVAGFGSTTLSAHAELHEDNLSVDLSGIDGLIGNFGAQANLTLAGSVLEASSYRDATGNAEIRISDVSLEPVNLALGKTGILRNLTGRGALQLLLERSQAKTQPNVLLDASLVDFGFEAVLGQGKSYTLSNGRLRGNLAYNAQSGTLNSAVTLSDDSGELLAGGGAMSLDQSALSLPPKQLAQAVLDAQADLVLSMSPRSIDRLPVTISGLLGTVSARATLRGSLAKPRLTGTVMVNNVVDASNPSAIRLNVLAQGEYLPLTGQITAQAAINQGSLRVASVLAEGQLPALGATTAEPAQGTLEAHLLDVPLQVLGPLAAGDVRGTLSGALRIQLRPEGVELRAMLSPHDIWALGTRLGNGTLTLDGSANHVYGQLDLAANQSSLAGSIALEFAPEQYLQTVQLDVNARNLEAGLLAPAVTTVFSGLSGSLDVQGRVAASRASADQKWETRLDGLAALREGTAHLQVLGLELQEVECTLGARSMGGQNVVSLSGLKAKARSSTHNVLGDASLTLAGLRVTNGEARLSIDEFPFTLEGVTHGWGTGNASAVLTRKTDHMLVEVNVAQLRTRLPLDTSREVVDIEANPDFRILQLQSDAGKGAGDLPWVIVVDLGSRTRIVKSKVQLLVTGVTRIDIGDRVSLSGTLTLLPGGRLNIRKPFVIEHGTVSLNPADSKNPLIDVRAAWRAPDGVTIYASAHGPWKELNDVELSSDSGLSRDEILEHLTGSTSSVASSSNDDTDPSAAGGINAVAFGANELLGDALSDDVELRIDPAENASYGAAVRVTDRLWFEGRYQRDEAAASVGGPSNVVTGAFDYRFAKKWSLRTELGNAGGTFDLLWQHRY
jgi:hypothetical protein